jgi:hypothetical protein
MKKTGKKMSGGSCRRESRFDKGDLVRVAVPAWFDSSVSFGIVLSNWGRTPGTDIWTYQVSLGGTRMLAYTGNKTINRAVILGAVE